MKFINGAVYKRGIWTFVLVYLDSKWGMLHIHRHDTKGMSAPMFQHGDNHKFQFTEKELIKNWGADNWIMLDGRLRIEKINDMSFVEYTNGELNEI